MNATARNTAAKYQRRTTNAKIPLEEQAYQAIRWEILTTKLRPGTIHNEVQLCERFGLGRSPVHLALVRLEMDGLVEIIPRKGILIPVVTQEVIRNVMEVRIPVERTIVKLAVERATDEELDAIKTLLEDGHSIDSDDREGYMRLDQEFHRRLAEVTHNSVLVDVLDMVHHRSSILWYVGISGGKDFRAVQEEHEKLLNAIIERDQAKAGRLITKHLTRFLTKTNNEIML